MHNSQTFSSLYKAGKVAKHQGQSPSSAISINSVLEHSYLEPSYSPFDPVDPDYRHYLLLRALPRVIQNELTELQRECLIMRYFNGFRISEISKYLGISESVVSRHISKSENIIRRILGYLFAS